MAGLFISYRRDDHAGFAARLADALALAFGAEAVFRDIDDIRPGEDYVEALRQQLAGVDLIVVVIGPSWLTLRRSGVRRIDAAGDFVRMEIESGMAAGKALLPVLVGGAAMPIENDLPPSIAALARHQAFVLSDSSWASDIARLVEAIISVAPVRRRATRRARRVGTVAAIAIIALIAVLALLWPALEKADRDPASSGEGAGQSAKTLAGRWTARVHYDWGAVHDETLELAIEHGDVHGSVSYLGVPRMIEQGRLVADRLSFVTRTQEALGDATSREVTHRYSGPVRPDELRLRLESGGGYSTHTPVELIARRAPSAR